MEVIHRVRTADWKIILTRIEATELFAQLQAILYGSFVNRDSQFDIEIKE